MKTAEPAAKPAPAPARAADAPVNRTMMGLPGQMPGFAAPAAPAAPAPAAPAPATPAAAAPPRGGIPQKTIMGMTSPFVAGLHAPLHGQKAQTAPASSGGQSEARPEPQPDPRPPEPGKDHKRTVMGVAPPADVMKAIREANAGLNNTPEPASAPPPPAAPVAKPTPIATPAASAPANRTMLGMMAPLPPAPPREPEAAPATQAAPRIATTPMAQPPAAPAPTATPESKLSPKSDRTMLGHPAAPRAEPPRDEPERAFTPPLASTRAESFDDSSQISTRPASGGTLRALLSALAGALVVLAIGLTAWHFFGSSGPALRVAVVQGDEGEALSVQVPNAAPGTRVRFSGAEQELRSGEAKFALAADALALGDNDIVIGVVNGSAVDSTTVRLHVGYRARVELAGLARDPATLDVVVDALPGSKVAVDGKPLTLDAKGHGVQSYPIAPQSEAKLPFSAKYQVTGPDGTSNDGALALNLPVSSLQIDRPGPSMTTDQSSVEVAGAVESNAEVSVNGEPSKVNEGRFLSRVKLPKPAEYTIHVVARVAGKVPRALDLHVNRVTDLTLAAASFKPDSALNYARIAQNPVIYRGQNVAFDGRVYNVEVKGGQSHLQMLVRDCPSSQRCPLWVELPQATDATVDSWVRVLGTVAGEQQFRSERGQVHTVPSVNAQYVLKLAK